MIQDFYEMYRIMPALQLHQLRVAGVAAYICGHIQGVKIDRDDIVAACLLHDMGNILKFNFDLFPEFLQPQGKDYWEKVQRDYRLLYGNDAHEATIEITNKIMKTVQGKKEDIADDRTGDMPVGSKVKKHNDASLVQSENQKRTLWINPARVTQLINSIGFSHARENADSSDYSVKIAAYADMRVTPFGVASLSKRLKDGHARFKLRLKERVLPEGHFEEMTHHLSIIERQIFEKIPTDCQLITDNKVSDYVQEVPFYNLICVENT